MNVEKGRKMERSRINDRCKDKVEKGERKKENVTERGGKDKRKEMKK